MTIATCRKCGAEPAAGKSRYGRACLAEAKRRQRETRETGETGETSRETGGEAELGPSLGWQGEVKRLRELCREKDEEIARLKRALAEAHKDHLPAPAKMIRTDAVGVNLKAGKGKATGEFLASHGERCQCLACRGRG